MDSYDALKLENQLCFPLYACSRLVVKQYRPFLEELDLTYTQYIAMMVLWERKKVTAKDLGKCLCLDSGTLTPVLKSLDAKGFITRQRSVSDERVLLVGLTDKGLALRERALAVPEQLASCLPLDPAESRQLYELLYKVLAGIEHKRK